MTSFTHSEIPVDCLRGGRDVFWESKPWRKPDNYFPIGRYRVCRGEVYGNVVCRPGRQAVGGDRGRFQHPSIHGNFVLAIDGTFQFDVVPAAKTQGKVGAVSNERPRGQRHVRVVVCCAFHSSLDERSVELQRRYVVRDTDGRGAFQLAGLEVDGLRKAVVDAIEKP